MSKGPEHRLYDWLRLNLPPSWHMTRIETSTANGIPDINLATGSGDVWLECKYSDKAVLRKEQWAWMQRRTACGGTCLVLLQKPIGWELFRIGVGMPHPVTEKGIRLEQPCAHGLKMIEVINILHTCTTQS